jgi:two-component system chemotaxis sensor kinase CheA
MGMDAVTSKALDTLAQDILPQLRSKVDQFKATLTEKRAPDSAFQHLLRETFELLKLLEKWNLTSKSNEEGHAPAGVKHSKKSTNELSDDEALAALAAMDGNFNDSVLENDMSDEAAMAALAAMDESPASDIPSDSDELSDDEALRLLALMDEGPGADIPVASVGSKSSYEDDMSADDAALSMLADMETSSFDEAPTAKVDSHLPLHGAGHAVETEDLSEEEAIEEIEEFTASEFSADPEMIKDFTENAAELMQSLDEQVLILESNPTSKETIEEIFRAAHTLKGAAGMFGYKAIERVMHRMENYFDRVRKGQVVADSDAIDVVLRGIDLLKVLMSGVAAGSPSGVATAPLVRELSLLGEGKYVRGASPAKAAVAKVPKKASPKASENKSESAGDVQDAGVHQNSAGGDGPKAKKQEESSIRVDLKRLDALVNLVGELVTDRTRFMNIEEELRINNPHLISTQNMTQTVQLFGRHMNEIQDTIMKVRMVPIGNAFNKFGRIIRDLSRQLNKEIDLLVEGETTELDKTLVEQIGDPLVHLIRNSCDHGIEAPDVRRKAGKRALGTIVLSARQEGNQIVITIEDDGKGIDTAIIRKKGIEKGMISEEDILTDRDIYALIFAPGFSTAEQVTNVSGRGVGMDVVKRQITKLKGTIDVTSKVGIGTTIMIQLPLTLAIVQSLLIKSKGEVFAIPLSSVVESIRISPKDIQKVGDAEVIKRRDQILPLYYLDEVLELAKRESLFWYKKPEIVGANSKDRNRSHRRLDERLYVVVVGPVDRRFGIVVDTLLNQQEMVIKAMGTLVSAIPCVAGGAILGNGEVVLVLDTGEMDALIRSKGRVGHAA